MLPPEELLFPSVELLLSPDELLSPVELLGSLELEELEEPKTSQIFALDEEELCSDELSGEPPRLSPLTLSPDEQPVIKSETARTAARAFFPSFISNLQFRQHRTKTALRALPPAYLQIFRHLAQILLEIRQYYFVGFIQSDEKFADVIGRQSLCGVALIFRRKPFNKGFRCGKNYLILCIFAVRNGLEEIVKLLILFKSHCSS